MKVLAGIFTGYLLTLIFLATLGPLRSSLFASEAGPGIFMPTALSWLIAVAISMGSIAGSAEEVSSRLGSCNASGGCCGRVYWELSRK
ncbi:MAG: hypothetical protein TU35_006795 [Thermoproteus sp. AZ2]|uniref:Uncharacterized protein n=1 Tax=Thermoproteus sp. AZ2 TaxID=1609232 RepID=A0ACC6V268_9CREN